MSRRQSGGAQQQGQVVVQTVARAYHGAQALDRTAGETTGTASSDFCHVSDPIFRELSA